MGLRTDGLASALAAFEIVLGHLAERRDGDEQETLNFVRQVGSRLLSVLG